MADSKYPDNPLSDALERYINVNDLKKGNVLYNLIEQSLWNAFIKGWKAHDEVTDKIKKDEKSDTNTSTTDTNLLRDAKIVAAWITAHTSLGSNDCGISAQDVWSFRNTNKRLWQSIRAIEKEEEKENG